MQVKIEYGSYNSRRYSRPWGAVITFAGAKPQYNFKAASYLGDDDGGNVVITCEPGDIVATGQKDGRQPRNTFNDWYIAGDNGALTEVTKTQAFDHLASKQA